MIKSENTSGTGQKKGGKRRVVNRIKKLASMGRISTDIINEIHSPIDSINRFLNLALMTVGEDAPSRTFLLESKDGVRKTTDLLKRLNDQVKRIEQEIKELSERHGQDKDTDSR